MISMRHAPFSPRPRDPRFSRRTPDKLRAQFAAANSGTRVVGDTRSWIVGILHTKARKTMLKDPKRKQILELLEKCAKAAEIAAAEKKLEVNIDSTAPEAAEAPPETLSLMPRQRATFASEVVQCTLGT